MKVYANYPEGHKPSGGIFYVEDNRDGISVEAVGEFVSIDATTNALMLTPTKAREFAAALIEVTDYIDRAAMTPADVAEETRARR